MRADRLVSLILLLQNRGRLTARQLAEALEVTERTVYRDVEALSGAGIPIIADRGPDGGYRLMDGYRTRLTGLTSVEAESLLFTGMPRPAAELGLGPHLAAAELKLMAALPATYREASQRIRERFHLDPSGWFRDPDPVPHLVALADAVWRERVVEVRYRRWSPEPKVVKRRLWPLGVVLKAGVWYLVGERAGQSRTYRVSNVASVDVTDEVFARPSGFDLPAFWERHVERYEGDAYAEHATVSLSPTGLATLPDVLGGKVGRAALASAGPSDEDGWRTVRLPVESIGDATADLLKLGAHARVIGPPDLVDRMAATVRTLASYYPPPASRNDG